MQHQQVGGLACAGWVKLSAAAQHWDVCLGLLQQTRLLVVCITSCGLLIVCIPSCGLLIVCTACCGLLALLTLHSQLVRIFEGQCQAESSETFFCIG